MPESSAFLCQCINQLLLGKLKPPFISEIISVHRLLTLFVFLLSWTAVCAAPRRMGGNSIPLFELDREPMNILKPNSSHTKAAISFLEAIMKASSGPSSSEDGDNSEYLLQSPLSSSSSSFSPSTSSSTSATTSSTTTKAKTGSEPDVVLNSQIFPPPPDSMMLPGLGSNPGYFSQRVAFSVERPETPPWPDFTFEPGFNEEGNGDDETSHSRRRRAVGDLQEVCKSTSRWGIKEWATDTFGQNVTILSKIMSAGNQELRQWFYETTCTMQHGVQSCLGIDDNHYESMCMTKNAWVYAMIRTRRGEEGWSWIAISSSCNCAVRQRFAEATGHVDRVR
ncbi:neurotrophin-4-like [Diadema antillarum]|uniref:neurotrophin-4-like n=1 Tax=Diadema antillarum TaxID=105358 RepID=UPI003A8C4B30